MLPTHRWPFFVWICTSKSVNRFIGPGALPQCNLTMIGILQLLIICLAQDALKGCLIAYPIIPIHSHDLSLLANSWQDQVVLSCCRCDCFGISPLSIALLWAFFVFRSTLYLRGGGNIVGGQAHTHYSSWVSCSFH